MSDTILAGDFTVYYLAENRQKRVVWTGSATGTRTVNQLYSALADLLDDLNQMDDGSVMSAQTPTAYTIGNIDPSDKDPWFIDRTSVEHLTGGALTTAGWTRATTTAAGIVRVPYTIGTDFIAGDIGKTVTNATSTATGTLLDFNTTGTIKYMWIRPATFAASNDWSGAVGTVTVTAGSAASVTQSGAAVSGDGLWSNIFSLGTIVANTHLYIYQNGTHVNAYKGSNDWWPDGQFDILLNVKEVGNLIDGGFATVEAREYDNTYSDYTADLHSGGRNPIPLAAGSDLNNTTGYREFTGSAGTGTFVVGDVLSAVAGTKKAVVTKVAGTGAAPILDYYLIGTLLDFANTDAITTIGGSGATCTAAAPINVGPAAGTVLPTITYGANNTFDIPQSGVNQGYSIVIDLLGTGTQQSVAQGYEWTKYLSRRGNQTQTNLPTINGEAYIGSDYRINYATITGTINVGDVVTQLTSGASGTVVANNTTPASGSKYLILRNSRGTFDNTNSVQKDGANHVDTPTSTAITPIHAAPFGTFAGGTWFCAPGVVLKNVQASDTNKYQLVDDQGTVRKAPTSVTVAVSNTRLADGVSVFKLTVAGGTINKAQYAATVQAIGATTIVVGSAITQDTPGKTAGGIIRLVQGNTEFRTRYNSWSVSTFTLASYTGRAATAGTTTTSIFDSTATFQTQGILVGDVVRNLTRAVVGYVTQVVSQTQINVTTMAGFVSTDSYEINTLPVATTAADNYYIPVVDVVETAGTDVSPGSQSRSVVYLADVPVVIRARHNLTGDQYNILPFETTGTITVSGLSVSTIRTKDTIST
jgi:hypothetical protein